MLHAVNDVTEIHMIRDNREHTHRFDSISADRLGRTKCYSGPSWQRLAKVDEVEEESGTNTT